MSTWDAFPFYPCPGCCECNALFANPNLTLVFSGITLCCLDGFRKITGGDPNTTIVIPKSGYCTVWYLVPAYFTVTSYEGGSCSGTIAGTESCDMQLYVCCVDINTVSVTMAVSTSDGNPIVFGGSGPAGTPIENGYPLCSSGELFGAGGTCTVSA
jgi:hypothetical protein